MHTRSRGLAALGAATTALTAVAGSALVALAAPAAAAGAVPADGSAMTTTPETGNNLVVPAFTTSAGCPSSATHTYVLLFGGALPDEGQVIKDVSRAGLTTSGGFTVEASRTFQDTFAEAGLSSIAPATYRAQLTCTNEVGARLATFTDDVQFTSATQYTTSVSGGVRDITNACPPGSTPAAPFSDVARSNTAAPAIDCIVSWKVTSGKTATTYDPAGQVSRGQMARFIANLVVNSGGALPASPPDAFADDNGTTHELAVNQLAAIGVVGGRADGSYGADANVTRAQMAKFLVEAFQKRTGATLASTRDHFADDNGIGELEGYINRAAEAGFAGGRVDGTYGPVANVNREQMARFLARVLDKLAAEHGAVRPS